MRGSSSIVNRRVRKLVESGERLATNEVVVMEVLAGARDDTHEQKLRRLLFGCELLPLEGVSDYEDAAGLYRKCRREGKTIRSLTDCLIAIVAIRAGAELLHADRDFETLALVSSLRLASV